MPAFVPVAPLLASMTPIWAPMAAELSARNASFARQYDPFKVRLSMSAEQVDRIYGPPHTTVFVPHSDREIRVYGKPCEQLESSLHGPQLFSWVSVTLEAGQVTRVFSNDFFDERLRAKSPKVGRAIHGIEIRATGSRKKEGLHGW